MSAHGVESKTVRFTRELMTSETIQMIAERHGVQMTVFEAHQCWAEHSDDYCAGWLAFDDADCAGEIRQALTKWQARHRPQSAETAK